MINIKDKAALLKMADAGARLAEIFVDIASHVVPGKTTASLDGMIESMIDKRGMKSAMKGYCGYRHVSCISINDQVVHGVPNTKTVIKEGDLVKIDVCVSYQGYCADMARPFMVGMVSPLVRSLVEVGQQSLNCGIASMVPGNRLSEISVAVQKKIESHEFSVVRDFAGHGIGKKMHEEPEILNYGVSGKGPLLQVGMVFAIEPMLNAGKYEVYIGKDGWTVYTRDGSLAMHVEDTVAVTENGPRVLTRIS